MFKMILGIVLGLAFGYRSLVTNGELSAVYLLLTLATLLWVVEAWYVRALKVLVDKAQAIADDASDSLVKNNEELRGIRKEMGELRSLNHGLQVKLTSRQAEINRQARLLAAFQKEDPPRSMQEDAMKVPRMNSSRVAAANPVPPPSSKHLRQELEQMGTPQAHHNGDSSLLGVAAYLMMAGDQIESSRAEEPRCEPTYERSDPSPDTSYSSPDSSSSSDSSGGSSD